MKTMTFPHISFLYKSIFLILLFFLFQQEWLFAIQKKPVIRVGIFQNAPLSYVDDQGVAQGIYPDIIREIAKVENWNLKFVLDTWSGNLERLRDGDIDLMVSIIYSKERDKIFDFSKEPVVTAWGQVYTRQDSGIVNILDLEGKTLAVMEKDINAERFKWLTREFNIKSDFINAKTYDGVCQLILAGKADAGVINNINGEFLKRRYNIYPTPIIFTPGNAVFAAPENYNRHLLDKIDLHLSKWRKDHHSIYYDLLNKWLGDIKVNFKLPYKLLAIIVSTAAAILIFLFIWMRVLRNQVKIRTDELSENEKALRESENKFRLIFEHAPLGILHFDNNGVITACNDNFVDIIGSSKKLLLGLNMLDLPEINIVHALEKALKGSTAKFDGEYKSVTANKVSQVRLVFNPVFSRTGVVEGGIGIIEDITASIQTKNEKEKLRIQLQQAQKMETIGTLAGGIAHDFNNILFPVMGHTEMLMQDIAEDSPFQDSLKKIYSGTLRAKDLIQQILTFSRQENREFILMKIQPIIKEALKLIRSSISATIEIKHDIQKDCGKIKADPTQIHQVVMNLITNAYHAMEDAGGQLKVSLKEVQLGESDIITIDMMPGAYACLMIADTGKGIDKNLTQKIFDPFFTTKGKGQGTGMGLSVVHGIVESVGGTIQVYSELGFGTQFYIYFPIVKSFSEKKNIQIEEPIQYGTEKILLIDDEKAILTMEKKMLKRLGYQVTSYASSLEALEAFRAAPDKFDLIITDMGMPNIPGDKLSAQLFKIRSDIPILLCTGFSKKISEEKAMSLGIKGFILKPVVLKDLSQKIREVLG
ncbi:MAG: transporter substrate-binding domain-containing protein [Desulfobacteraceae bacterium]|nr:transporter substrate-binding domain-containing protein [Desulfobacteraceae bacterium]